MALAAALASRGARLALVARSADKLQKLAANWPQALAIPSDLGHPGEARRVVEEAARQFGRLDLLVNNAGQGLRTPFESIAMQDYRAIMDLNVFAVFEAMQAAIPLMRRQGGGMILNVGSMVSKNAFPLLAAYASTKYALNALTYTAREELKADHIAVSVFHPKMTATAFGHNARGQQYDSAAGRPGMTVDTAAQVADAMVRQIETESPEEQM